MPTVERSAEQWATTLLSLRASCPADQGRTGNNACQTSNNPSRPNRRSGHIAPTSHHQRDQTEERQQPTQVPVHRAEPKEHACPC